MKKLRGIVGSMMMMLTGMVLSLGVMASPLAVKIPVTVSVKGEAPDTPESFEINLKADDASYPMPAGASAGIYQTTVQGEGSADLAIDYSRVGEYTYTISQTPGKNKNAEYDTTVYRLVVTITNPETGEGLESVVALHTDAMKEKPDAAAFVNSYKPAETEPHTDKPPAEDPKPNPKPSNVKTGDNSPIMTWIFIAAVSFMLIIGAAIAIITRRRNNR